MWEDEKNKQGGRWLVNSNRNQRSELDRIWLETVRAVNFLIKLTLAKLLYSIFVRLYTIHMLLLMFIDKTLLIV